MLPGFSTARSRNPGSWTVSKRFQYKSEAQLRQRLARLESSLPEACKRQAFWTPVERVAYKESAEIRWEQKLHFSMTPCPRTVTSGFSIRPISPGQFKRP